MKELVFVGLGLHNERGISFQGIEETRTADQAFMELYTSILPCFSIERFEEIVNKQVHLVSRRDLEEENGALILDAAEKGKAVFLIPGRRIIPGSTGITATESPATGNGTAVANRFQYPGLFAIIRPNIEPIPQGRPK